MKHCTTIQQTMRLIELGYAKPKSIFSVATDTVIYTLTDLLQLLPKETNSEGCRWPFTLEYDHRYERWIASFHPFSENGIAHEAIDAVYNLLVNLKKEKHDE